ncbi:hypothetical protein K3495_g6812 [Podosphaera aphanis]|nr:hypothetical protein K3495_g6812 [Podosphaera aphanis]
MTGFSIRGAGTYNAVPTIKFREYHDDLKMYVLTQIGWDSPDGRKDECAAIYQYSAGKSHS